MKICMKIRMKFSMFTYIIKFIYSYVNKKSVKVINLIGQL